MLLYVEVHKEYTTLGEIVRAFGKVVRSAAGQWVIIVLKMTNTRQFFKIHKKYWALEL